ncbi:Piso0_002560 [Millerozyma farinosa CBS 7064]|uniref:Piso0_002560 protein n=1 Tax=Pichia sorbitophila (strain ATCC MYA-4447 / BCRC 22081 / CBS 7064 / NBRC 10061 / NRRL Y-12695) TaxID=559304 RepID=G8YFD2_PICSO|nr:Piso0_002560 [Millerozyma farinosa CBS 7064]
MAQSQLCKTYVLSGTQLQRILLADPCVGNKAVVSRCRSIEKYERSRVFHVWHHKIRELQKMPNFARYQLTPAHTTAKMAPITPFRSSSRVRRSEPENIHLSTSI